MPQPTVAAPAHRQLARALGGRRTVITVPLLTATDHPVGAVLVSFPPPVDGAAFSQSADASDAPDPVLFLQRLAAPLAEILAAHQRAAPGRVAGAIDALADRVSQRGGRRWLVAMAVVTVLAMVPVRYPVRTEVTLQARARRSVAAPLSAVLEQVHVMPGQSVRSGQLLLTLDDTDTATRLATLQAEAQRATAQRAGHLAAGRLAEAELARLEAARVAGEIDLLRLHLQRTEVRSPIDGVVLCEELEPLVGAPLEMGQLLLEIAPPEQFTAELQIPPDQVCHVQPQQPVAIRLASAGALPVTRVLRVHPRAHSNAQGQYVFTATARVTDNQGRLKPGMQGVGIIYGDRRPWIWCTVQRIWQRVRTWV